MNSLSTSSVELTDKTQKSPINNDSSTIKKSDYNAFSYKLYSSWIIIPIYMFFVVNSGSIYWGFSGGFREMFLKMEAYDWIDDVRQETAIGVLLTVANLSNLVADGVAGNVLDYLGPRYTLFAGVILRFLGWICLGVSSQTLQLYVVGMALIGASTDLIYFPFVSCAALFNQKRGLIVSLLGASMSLSSIVPIGIFQVWDSLFTNLSSFAYLGIYSSGWLIMMMLVAIFLTPVQSFESIKKMNQRVQMSTSNSFDRFETISINSPVQNLSRSAFLANWFKPLLKPSFLLIVPVGCILILRSEYVQRTTAIEIPETYDLWVILSPLRFFPCIIMGEISDLIGHVKTMFLMEAIAAIIFISNFFTGFASDFVTTIGMFFFTSWIMTSQYVFISKTQPANEFGRLSGAISVIAGAFLFLNILIAPLTEQDTGRLIVGICMLCLSIVNSIILGSTYLFDYKLTWISGFK